MQIISMHLFLDFSLLLISNAELANIVYNRYAYNKGSLNDWFKDQDRVMGN